MAAGTSYNYSQRGDMVVNRRGQNTVRHSPTNFRRFRLVKGIDTHLTFFVKDEQTEYGPMYLHDVNITAQLVTVDGQNIVLTKVLENEDLATKEQIAAWRNTYKKYVPLHRIEVESDTMPPRGSGYNIRGKESQLRVGSTKEVDHSNIITQIVSAGEATLVRAEKNKVDKDWSYRNDQRR